LTNLELGLGCWRVVKVTNLVLSFGVMKSRWSNKLWAWLRVMKSH